MTLLDADKKSKLSVVHTGVRVFELTNQAGVLGAYRLTQDGIGALMQRRIITKQLVEISVPDMVVLHQKRLRIGLDELSPGTAERIRSTLQKGSFVAISSIPVGSDGDGGDGRPPSHQRQYATAIYCMSTKVEVRVPQDLCNAFLIKVGSLGITTIPEGLATGGERGGSVNPTQDLVTPDAGVAVDAHAPAALNSEAV